MKKQKRNTKTFDTIYKLTIIIFIYLPIEWAVFPNKHKDHTSIYEAKIHFSGSADMNKTHKKGGGEQTSKCSN